MVRDSVLSLPFPVCQQHTINTTINHNTNDTTNTTTNTTTNNKHQHHTTAPPTAVPDVRDIVDWQYYKDRLGSAVQKIITIPAAMQHVANPCPRVKHPDWLHKRVRERDSRSQQLRLDALFAEQRARQQQQQQQQQKAVGDIEDLMAGKGGGAGGATTARVRLRRRDAGAGGGDQDGADAAADAVEALDVSDASDGEQQQDGTEARGGQAGPSGAGAAAAAAARGGRAQQQQQQQQQFGPRPDRRADYRAWVAWQKQKWRAVRQERKRRKVEAARARGRGGGGDADGADGGALAPAAPPRNAAQFFRQQQARAAAAHWQLLQLAPTGVPGTFKAWVLADQAMYAVPLRVPRTLYVDSALPPTAPGAAALGRPVRAALPFGRAPQHVYQVGPLGVGGQALTTSYQLLSALISSCRALTRLLSPVADLLSQ